MSEGAADDFRPAALYEKYLPAANEGDANARYVLVTALAECRNTVKSRAGLAALEQRGVPADSITSVQARFERCSALLTTVSNIEEEYNRWYEAVREAGHPLIAVKEQAPIDRKRELLRSAIAADYPEPYLYADAFAEAARFYSTYPETLDKYRQEAWLLLYCAASYHCDSDAERTQLRSIKYLPHQYAEIEKIEASLRDAIERRDWSALDF